MLNKIRYETNSKKYEIERIVNELKRDIFKFEIGSFKSKEKILAMKNDINNTYETLVQYRGKVKGFNWWCFLIGFSAYHVGFIFYTKKLLYELNRGLYVRHLGLCTVSGVMLGSLVGYRYSSDIGLYRYLTRAQKDVKQLSDLFEYYYILNKEEEFDD
jgi:hypothetical protein